MSPRVESFEEWVEGCRIELACGLGDKLVDDCLWNVKKANELPSGKGLVYPAIIEAKRPVEEAMEARARLPVPLDASDYQIRMTAKKLADVALDFARIYHEPAFLRKQMEYFCLQNLIIPPKEKVKDMPAIKRMSCPKFWTRGIRKTLACYVELLEIKGGFVHKKAQLYVSDKSVERRVEQNKRNGEMMSNTLMRNETTGDEFTLAELSALSVSNKAIRRGELMARITGFERYAIKYKHVGVFMTITCPSRMHKWIDTGKNSVRLNKKYDGTSPKEANNYLVKMYAAVRAKLNRQKLGIYGFRIAEPHHDGCPHWHLLFFCEPQHEKAICDIFRDYALQDSPDEPGAQEHRIKIVKMDASKGSAAGYIAKYVAKNIDGLHVGKDLFGNDAMGTSLRVETWATTWGIRQFQQIGGAPIGVYREMRRLDPKTITEKCPAHIQMAFDAVNKRSDKPVSFMDFIEAMGGVFIGRKGKIQLEKELAHEFNQYGEEGYLKVVGVKTASIETYRLGIIPDMQRLVYWIFRSLRYVWTLVGFGGKATASSSPRTRVNNCTVSGVDKSEKFSILDENIWRPAYCYG